MIKFNQIPMGDLRKIHQRAAKLAGFDIDWMSFCMDMGAANGVNGNLPIDVAGLLAADDFNFAHDVFGIMRHINRETGAIDGFFVPRFTAAAQAA